MQRLDRCPQDMRSGSKINLLMVAFSQHHRRYSSAGIVKTELDFLRSFMCLLSSSVSSLNNHVSTAATY